MLHPPHLLKKQPQKITAFFLAARPKTWTASICPVLLGTSLAAREGGVEINIFLLTLLFSLCIQIGTNYANDYFDFIKGADNTLRMGPKRAVQQGWISPRSMLRATWFAFTIALLFALPLILKVGIWSLSLPLLFILCGLLYTGGPKPLGYLGLGELFVFLFFGPVAVLGAYFLQTNHLFSIPLLTASLSPGLLSACIMMINNLRDEKTDRLANKKTLIVRFGKTFGCWLYIFSIGAAAVTSTIAGAWLGCNWTAIMTFLCSLFLSPYTAVFSADYGKALPRTSLILACHTILFCTALL